MINIQIYKYNASYSNNLPEMFGMYIMNCGFESVYIGTITYLMFNNNGN